LGDEAGGGAGRIEVRGGDKGWNGEREEGRGRPGGAVRTGTAQLGAIEGDDPSGQSVGAGGRGRGRRDTPPLFLSLPN